MFTLQLDESAIYIFTVKGHCFYSSQSERFVWLNLFHSVRIQCLLFRHTVSRGHETLKWWLKPYISRRTRHCENVFTVTLLCWSRPRSSTTLSKAISPTCYPILGMLIIRFRFPIPRAVSICGYHAVVIPYSFVPLREPNKITTRRSNNLELDAIIRDFVDTI